MDSTIFDVDGTLWDSTDVVAKAWTDYLRQKEQIDLYHHSRSAQNTFRKAPGRNCSSGLSRISGE